MKKYYLAYGSNLNLHQMSYRCKSANPIGNVIIKDYRLVYKGSADQYSYLTLEQSKNSIVPLGLYEVSYSDILSLDLYEGYPKFYSKYYIPIKINGKVKKAIIYIMNKNFDYHLPSQKYIDICTKGYNDFGFDKNILKQALEDTKRNIPKIKRK